MGRSWSDHTTVQLNARPHRSGGGQQRRRQQQQQQQKRRSVPLIGDDQAQKSRTSQLMMGRFANQAIIKLTRSSARASGGRCVIAVRESHPPLRGKKKLKPKELYSASLFLCLCVCVFRLFSRAPLSRLTRKLITTNRRPTTKKQSKPSKTQPAKKSSANRRGGRWVRKRNEEKVLFFPCYELRNNTSLWPTSIVGAQDTIGRNRNQIVCEKKKRKEATHENVEGDRLMSCRLPPVCYQVACGAPQTHTSEHKCARKNSFEPPPSLRPLPLAWLASYRVPGAPIEFLFGINELEPSSTLLIGFYSVLLDLK